MSLDACPRQPSVQRAMNLHWANEDVMGPSRFVDNVNGRFVDKK